MGFQFKEVWFENLIGNPDMNFWRDAPIVVYYFVFWVIFYQVVKLVSRPLAIYFLTKAHREEKQKTTSSEPIEAQEKSPDGLRHRPGKNTNAPKPEQETDTWTPTAMEIRKWQVAAWKWVDYSFQFTWGLTTLLQTDWFPNTCQVYWVDWPAPIPTPFMHYFALVFAHYVHALIALPFEPKMSDMAIMTIHHLITIFLIIMAYVSAYYRMASMIIILTDASDPLLEGSKLLLYSGYQKAADMGFVLFAIVFISTRIFVFGYEVIYCGAAYGYIPTGEKVPGYNFYLLCMGLLFGLFVYWTLLILKMAVKMQKNKSIEKDIRE